MSINKADLASLIRSSRALKVKSLGEVSEQLRGEASEQLRPSTASEPVLAEVGSGPLIDKDEEEILCPGPAQPDYRGCRGGDAKIAFRPAGTGAK